jgi:hypothetical protein
LRKAEGLNKKTKTRSIIPKKERHTLQTGKKKLPVCTSYLFRDLFEESKKIML